MPAVLGGALSFHGTAHGPGRSQSLDWSFLASARGMSFPGWRELLPEYLTRLDAGTGGLSKSSRTAKGRRSRERISISARRAWSPTLTDGPSAKFEQISGALDR